MKQGLIVEDLPDARAWLLEATQAAFPEMTLCTADCLAAARAATAACAFDIALVDLGLPDGDGLDLIRELAPTDTLCVVTTVFSDDAHLFSALQAGAGGYVLKDRDRDSIADLLRGIAAGQPPLSPAIARRLLRFFQREPAQREPAKDAPSGIAAQPALPRAATAIIAPPPANTGAVGAGRVAGAREAALPAANEGMQLTARERDVLTLIAKGYAVARVADLLGITYNTAAGYVKAVYRKLNVSSRAEAALEASRRGLVV
jgi:DNA-binding NarL/FixJ family response regulator